MASVTDTSIYKFLVKMGNNSVPLASSITIGAMRRKKHSKSIDMWEWKDKSEWKYERWQRNEPQTHKDCAVLTIIKRKAGGWKSISCSEKHMFACRKQTRLLWWERVSDEPHGTTKSDGDDHTDEPKKTTKKDGHGQHG